MILTSIRVVTFLIGPMLVIPVLGHATRHAWKDLVDAAGLPPRHGPRNRPANDQ